MVDVTVQRYISQREKQQKIEMFYVSGNEKNKNNL
jgi:hypothetical protein